MLLFLTCAYGPYSMSTEHTFLYAVKAQEVGIEILACTSPCTDWLLAGKQGQCDWEDTLADPIRTLAPLQVVAEL